MKRTAKELFELLDVIGHCYGNDLHIIPDLDTMNEHTGFDVYSSDGYAYLVRKDEILETEFHYDEKKVSEDGYTYSFELHWQGNNKITINSAYKLLKQYQENEF
jgi:hypothetical protein